MRRFRKVVQLGALVVLPLALALLLGNFLLSAHREYTHFRDREEMLQERIATREGEFMRKHAYLEKLAHDPEFLDAVVRDRLGFVRSGEVIFRFIEE